MLRKLTFFTLILLSACSVKQQIDEAKTFGKCDFRFGRVEDLKISDISIQNTKRISDLSFKKAVRLATVLTEKTIPLTFTLFIDVYNPNRETAALNRIEWICLADGTEIATGAVEERIEIMPGSSSEVPVSVQADLKDIFGKHNKDTFLNLIFNLVGKDREPVHLQVKIKPTVMIGTWAMDYPGYISVEKDFTSEDGKKIRKRVKKEISD